VNWYEASKVQPNCGRTVIADFGGKQVKSIFCHARWWWRLGLAWIPVKQIPQRWRENDAILKLTGIGNGVKTRG